MKPPMPYSGGKQRIAQQIADTFPAHQAYIEPYGGALSVLLAKHPAKVEVVNDVNADLMTFWRVLRDTPAELQRVCALTPHSRTEFHTARDDLRDLTEVERARRVWVQLTQGRAARLRPLTGWRFVHGGNQMPISQYLDGYLARIGPCAARLRNVALENRPALDLLAAYDKPGVLFYLDPPYPASTRGGAQYPHEMLADTDHEDLLKAVTTVRGLVALSGYDNPLYRAYLSGWHTTRFNTTAASGAARVEVLWTNYPPADTDTLPFDQEAI
jgi:DNA adenine methylase